jgi:hypothetical protein
MTESLLGALEPVEHRVLVGVQARGGAGGVAAGAKPDDDVLAQALGVGVLGGEPAELAAHEIPDQLGVLAEHAEGVDLVEADDAGGRLSELGQAPGAQSLAVA